MKVCSECGTVHDEKKEVPKTRDELMREQYFNRQFVNIGTIIYHTCQLNGKPWDTDDNYDFAVAVAREATDKYMKTPDYIW